MSKLRSPWLLYPLFFFTGGHFGWIWILLLMSDINMIEMRRVFPIRMVALGVATYYVLLIALFILFFLSGASLSTHAMSIYGFFAVAIGHSMFWIISAIVIDRHIYRLRSSTYGFLDGVVTVLFTLLWGVSFIRAQVRINKLIARE
jgi:hypothetical protein